jgi:RNA-directed DNA polymerase
MLREFLAEKAGISATRLDFLEKNASRMYKTYTIPKRNGDKRTISQPTPEIKAIQRWLVRSIFLRMPTSESATAYRPGSSIILNAMRHRETAFTLHLDFEHFFPSFSYTNVVKYLSDKTKLGQRDIEFTSLIVSRNGNLTIGAPSSPAITNVLMYNFDESLSAWCRERNFVYTRYADDINISTSEPGVLRSAEKRVREIIDGYPYGALKLNEEKTAYLSKRYMRKITGIVVTTEGGTSIGRARKREIKSLTHLYMTGKLSEQENARLSGLLAFVNDADPHFLTALKSKYGHEVVLKLLHSKRVRRVIERTNISV